eukprot:scaffold2193_cov179-Ochromonas_danica.AAC.42
MADNKKQETERISNNYLIYGQFDEKVLSGDFADKGTASILYLTPDTPTDQAFPGGFAELKRVYTATLHVPFDPNALEYQPDNSLLAVPWQRVLAYKRYEEALLRLPLPTVLACKSGRRASAVYAAFRGVSERLTKEQTIELAEEQALTFVGHAGFSKWVEDVVDSLSRRTPLIFRQLYEPESSTYTYLLADEVTKEAVIIDPVLETVERDYNLIRELGLELKYILNTHVHADHIFGNAKLKEKVPTAKSGLLERAGKADFYLEEFLPVVFGSWKLYPISTPGHTNGCTSFVLDDLSRVFTGDALFIRGCGRTDFQQGSARTLYSSIHDKLYKYLPDQTLVYPGHDYKGQTVSSIYEEKTFNPRLTKSEDEFVHLMDNLNLAPPKKIDVSVPANLEDGERK